MLKSFKAWSQWSQKILLNQEKHAKGFSRKVFGKIISSKKPFLGHAGSSLQCVSFVLWQPVASLFAEHGLQSIQAQYLWQVGSLAGHGLSCTMACGILVPRPGIEPMSPVLENRFLTTGPPWKSHPPQFLKSRIRVITAENWIKTLEPTSRTLPFLTLPLLTKK